MSLSSALRIDLTCWTPHYYDQGGKSASALRISQSISYVFRFDRLVYLGISKTNEEQLDILKALTRKFVLDPDCDLMEVAQDCPFNYTGADFYALCADAQLAAVAQVCAKIDEKIGSLCRFFFFPNADIQ